MNIKSKQREILKIMIKVKGQKRGPLRRRRFYLKNHDSVQEQIFPVNNLPILHADISACIKC